MTTRVIEVIETEITRGKGVAGDPIRGVKQYHTLDGKLLAEHDEWLVTQTPSAEEIAEKILATPIKR